MGTSSASLEPGPFAAIFDGVHGPSQEVVGKQAAQNEANRDGEGGGLTGSVDVATAIAVKTTTARRPSPPPTTTRWKPSVKGRREKSGPKLSVAPGDAQQVMASMAGGKIPRRNNSSTSRRRGRRWRPPQEQHWQVDRIAHGLQHRVVLGEHEDEALQKPLISRRQGCRTCPPPRPGGGRAWNL